MNIRDKQRLRTLEQSGFSLAEMLVTITLIFILGVIGAPELVDTLASMRKASGKQLVRGDIRLLKSEALKQGLRSVLKVGPDYDNYRLGYDLLPFATTAQIEQGITARHLPSGVTVALDRDIIFDSRGYLISTDGTPTNASVKLFYHGEMFALLTVYSSGMVTDAES